MHPLLALSSDRSNIGLRFFNVISSKDTFYLSGPVKRDYSLEDPPLEFVTRPNCSLRMIPNQDIRLICSDFDILEEVDWMIGTIGNFFDCVHEKLLQTAQEGREVKLYNDSRDAKMKFSYLPGALYSAYYKGRFHKLSNIEMEIENPRGDLEDTESDEDKISTSSLPAEDNTTIIVEVGVALHRLTLLIRNILSYHWKGLHSAQLIEPSVTKLPEFISTSIWGAYLSLFNRDDHAWAV